MMPMTNSLADIVVKATPGEWKYDAQADNYGGVYAQTYRICGEIDLNGKPANVANAALICLAPTLATLVLEAREALRAVDDEAAHMTMTMRRRAIFTSARATLAKLEAL